jgi:hypothetical protein
VATADMSICLLNILEPSWSWDQEGGGETAVGNLLLAASTRTAATTCCFGTPRAGGGGGGEWRGGHGSLEETE